MKWRRCQTEERFVVDKFGDYQRCRVFADGANKALGAPQREGKTMTKTQGKGSIPAGDNLAGLFDPDFGEIYYGGLSPAYGAMIGAGAAGAGLLVGKALRKNHPRVAKWAGLVALGTGGVAAGVMIAMPRTRRAGYLAAAMAGLIAGIELLRGHWVEPQMNDSLGLYQQEIADQGITIMDAQADAIAEALVSGALGQGQPGVQILGQGTPEEAMGMYQPEIARPLEVGGVGFPY